MNDAEARVLLGAMREPRVFYHANCTDGAQAARIISLAKPGARLSPVEYASPPPTTAASDDVVLADFCYDEKTLRSVFWSCRTLLVIDHHASQSWLTRVPWARTASAFDLKRSGTGMAWDIAIGGPRPWWVDAVERNDLWLDRDLAVDAFVYSFPRTPDVDLSLYTETAARARGTDLLRQRETMTRHAMRQSSLRSVSFGAARFDVPVVNTADLQNEICNALCAGHPFALAWFMRGDGRVALSLRSHNDNGEHVNHVAATVGGGGHPHAAGAIVDAITFFNQILGGRR